MKQATDPNGRRRIDEPNKLASNIYVHCVWQ